MSPQTERNVRFSLALVLVSTMGAASTLGVPPSVWLIARALSILTLWIQVLHSTRNTRPTSTGASRRVFTFLYLIGIFAAMSVVFSQERLETLFSAATLLVFVSAVERLSTRRWSHRSVMLGDLQLIFVLVTAFLTVGVLAHYVGLLPVPYGGRFQGYFNNPNMAAQISVLAGLIGWGLFRELGGVWRVCLIVPSVATLLLSQSRASLAAAGLAVFWILARSGWKGIIAALALVLTTGIAIWIFGTVWVTSITQRFGDQAGGDSLSGRTYIWRDALGLIRDKPLGSGWATTPTLARSMGGYSSFHSGFIQVAVEGGVFALLFLTLVYVALLPVVLRVPTRGFAAGVSSLAIAGFIITFSESGLFGLGQPFPYLYWFGIGALLAMYNQQTPTEQGQHQTLK